MIRHFLPAILVIASAGAVEAEQVRGSFINSEGTQIGTITIAETPSGMLHLTLSARSLPPGAHGFHIHQTGRCDIADGFNSAGGHLAGDHEHGIAAEQGPHPGDFPNVHVAQDGTLEVEYFSDRISLREDNGLLDGDGAAAIIHADPDDYSSQPSGAAGGRIACAVLEMQ